MKVRLFFFVFLFFVSFACQLNLASSEKSITRRVHEFDETFFDGVSNDTMSQRGLLVCMETLTAEEFIELGKMLRFNEEIQLSRSVERFYCQSNGDTVLFLTKMIFEKEEGFFFDEFIEYEVEVVYAPKSIILTYKYSVGAAYSANGTLIMDMDSFDIVNIENSVGTGTGSVEIYVNGVLKSENTFEVK